MDIQDRSWVQDAKCYGTTNPQRYDCEEKGNNAWKMAELRIRAIEACEGCPVARQCAQTALRENWNGVISAGVPLPENNWWLESSMKARPNGPGAAVKKIAEGGDMYDAVLDMIPQSEAGAACRRVIEGRKEYFSRGMGPGLATSLRDFLKPSAIARRFGLSKGVVDRLTRMQRLEAEAGRDPIDCVAAWDLLDAELGKVDVVIDVE